MFFKINFNHVEMISYAVNQYELMIFIFGEMKKWIENLPILDIF